MGIDKEILILWSFEWNNILLFSESERQMKIS